MIIFIYPLCVSLSNMKNHTMNILSDYELDKTKVSGTRSY